MKQLHKQSLGNVFFLNSVTLFSQIWAQATNRWGDFILKSTTGSPVFHPRLLNARVSSDTTNQHRGASAVGSGKTGAARRDRRASRGSLLHLPPPVRWSFRPGRSGQRRSCFLKIFL